MRTLLISALVFLGLNSVTTVAVEDSEHAEKNPGNIH